MTNINSKDFSHGNIALTGQWNGKTAYNVCIMGRKSSNFANTTELHDIAEVTLQSSLNEYIYLPPAPVTPEIVSSSANDASAGTGVRTVRVWYLDTDWNFQNTTLTLNGTTPVSMSVQVNRILLMHSLTVGSDGVAAGNIILRVPTTLEQLEQISIGGNKSLSGRFTVPLGHTAFITRMTIANGTAANRYDVRLRGDVDPYFRQKIDGIFLFQDLISVGAGATHEVDIPYLKFPEKSDIKVSTLSSSTNNNLITVSWDMILIQN
jgi:hypothetical protein